MTISRWSREEGFTFFQLLIALVIAAILTVVALPMYGDSTPDCDNPNAKQGPLVRSRIAQVTGDLGQIHLAASQFEMNNNRFPDNLAELGLDNLRDPWGNSYQYFPVYQNPNAGHVRKDHNLHPVNSHYDIYSMGPDGTSAPPFTSTGGKDDIVMANDGDYFGLACQYNGSGK